MAVYNRALGADEISALYQAGTGFLFDEPPATNRLLWRGKSLDAGFPRLTSTNSSSIFYTLVDDKNTNGFADSGDDCVLAEYLVGGSTSTNLTLSRQPVTGSGLSRSYGLTCLNYRNTTNDVLFTGEPDGRVFSWIATNSSVPLQRQLFSGQHAGKAWHALAGVKTLEPGEGLVGLRVSFNAPNICDVMFWPPQRELPQVPHVPQTAPITSILSEPNSGNGLATNQVQLWDAEGNDSWLTMQFQMSGSINWTNLTIVSIDGLAQRRNAPGRLECWPAFPIWHDDQCLAAGAGSRRDAPW